MKKLDNPITWRTYLTICLMTIPATILSLAVAYKYEDIVNWFSEKFGKKESDSE